MASAFEIFRLLNGKRWVVLSSWRPCEAACYYSCTSEGRLCAGQDCNKAGWAIGSLWGLRGRGSYSASGDGALVGPWPDRHRKRSPWGPPHARGLGGFLALGLTTKEDVPRTQPAHLRDAWVSCPWPCTVEAPRPNWCRDPPGPVRPDWAGGGWRVAGEGGREGGKRSSSERPDLLCRKTPQGVQPESVRVGVGLDHLHCGPWGAGKRKPPRRVQWEARGLRPGGTDAGEMLSWEAGITT